MKWIKRLFRRPQPQPDKWYILDLDTLPDEERRRRLARVGLKEVKPPGQAIQQPATSAVVSQEVGDGE